MAGWIHPRDDCCSPCGTCCKAFMCPCMTFGNIKARRAGKTPSNCNGPCMGYAVLSLCCLQGIYQFTNRSNMRAQYQIQGTWSDDCCSSSCCCCCCALVQEDKESAARAPSTPAAAAQPTPQPQMVYSPPPGHEMEYFPPQSASPLPAPAAAPGMTAAEARLLTGFAQDATTIATTDIKADAGGF